MANTALRLAEALIARRSVTPADGGCQDLLAQFTPELFIQPRLLLVSTGDLNRRLIGCHMCLVKTI